MDLKDVMFDDRNDMVAELKLHKYRYHPNLKCGCPKCRQLRHTIEYINKKIGADNAL